VSRLQQDYGRWRWRWRAPLRERLALRLAQGEMTAAIVDADCATQEADTGRPGYRMTASSEEADPQMSKATVLLIEATASILADAERNGIDLSQAAMARQLRERGYRVGNDRLRWLVGTARAVLAENALDGEAA